MRIYIADIRALADEQVLLYKYRQLSQERRERIEKYRKPADRQRGVGAGLLLEYGLRQMGYSLLPDTVDKRCVRLEYGVYGKPCIQDASGICFNLSHAGDYVAAVFGENEVGIDIEGIRQAKQAVIRRVLTAEEQDYLKQFPNSVDGEFTRLWTRKESYIKAVGEGMHLPLNSFCVLEDCIESEETYHMRTWELKNDYMLTVCARQPIEAEVIEIDLVKSI